MSQKTLAGSTAIFAAVWFCAPAPGDPIPTTDPSLSDSDRHLKQIQSDLASPPGTVPPTGTTRPTNPPPTTTAPAMATSEPATRPWSPYPASTEIPGGDATTPGQLGDVVISSNLNAVRDKIAPSLGAQSYTIGPDQIAVTPQGENATFQQVLLRAPGVVEDSFGQEHVRGEHANITYRVNGVLLPESLNEFGQSLDTRLIQSATLIDGSLPAQFGFRTAGIVDVTTKSGATLKHNEVTLYGGTFNTFEPSVQYGGVDGKLDYFVTASSRHSSLGIESPTAGRSALHDDTNQQRFFSYLSYRLDDTSRLSLIVNAANSDFQIPDTRGLAPSFTLNGHPNPASADVDENQNEQQYYIVGSYLKTTDKFSIQASTYYQYGQDHFAPDRVGDLVFQGVSGDVLNTADTYGVQVDASYKVDPSHTVRFGLQSDYVTERLIAGNTLFATDPATGAQASTSPFTVEDNSGNHGTRSGIYIQDEWKLTKTLTLNYGLRYDRFDTNFDDNGQVSPRVNLVWSPDTDTTFHAGYSRFFVPPPLQWLQPGSIAKYGNTTNASAITADTPPKVERSNYFDIGASRQISRPWKVSLDGFYKDAHNLVDNGQFGAPLILSTYNYTVGHVYGAELSSTYTQGGFSAFGNFSWVRAEGQEINSNQFLFSADELAYIRNHYVKLDHEGNYTVSAGMSYTWTNDRVYVDLLYGSGLRRGFANTMKTQQYVPVSLGWEHHWKFGPRDVVRLRADVINVFDEGYELRDGSGLGVGAAQYGQRRTFLAGLSYEF